MKKAIGRFFIYLGIILGVCITAVLVCGVVLIAAPDSSIFGVRYIKLDKSYEHSYSDEEILNAQAIVIKTNRMSVNIEPNKTDDNLVVSYKEGVSGFVNVNSAKVSYSAGLSKWSFNDNAGVAYNNIDIFMIVFGEPEGWLFPKGNSVTIYVPESMKPKIYSAETKSGAISFVGESRGYEISPSELFIGKIEHGGGNVTVSYPRFDRYIVKTDSGTVAFRNFSRTEGQTTVNAIDADIEFITNSGVFDVSNSKNNGTINGAVKVVSSSAIGGPRFKADIINGDLSVYSKTGFITVGQLGSGNNYVQMQVFSTNVTVNIDVVYGTILSLPIDGEEPKVNYNIGYLTTPALSEIESGRGEVVFGGVYGDLKLTSTSGKIKVDGLDGNITASSTTGAIDITFKESAAAHELNITTREGEVKADNIKGKFAVSVLGESGRDNKMTLRFLKVVKGSTILGRGYDIDLISRVGSDIYMLVSKAPVTINPNASHGIFSLVLSGESDYTADFYTYRVGYSVWDDPRVDDNIGKIVIEKSATKGEVSLSGEV